MYTGKNKFSKNVFEKEQIVYSIMYLILFTSVHLIELTRYFSSFGLLTLNKTTYVSWSITLAISFIIAYLMIVQKITCLEGQSKL